MIPTIVKFHIKISQFQALNSQFISKTGKFLSKNVEFQSKQSRGHKAIFEFSRASSLLHQLTAALSQHCKQNRSTLHSNHREKLR